MLHLDFTKKTVIVTGGGSGIGYAIAKSFFDCGAHVVLCGHRGSILKQAVRKIERDAVDGHGKVIAFTCDMSLEKDTAILVKKTLKQFSRLDIFVNNAGMWKPTPIHAIKEADIFSLVKNNLVTTIFGTKYAAHGMKNGGVIINIGSFAGILPMRDSSVYSSIKSSVGQFTRSSAAELAKKIRVNCVIPGVIRTPMTSDYIDEHKGQILKTIPLGRIGTAEEVAHSVLFLASDLARYITGASLEVTGGKYATQL